MDCDDSPPAPTDRFHARVADARGRRAHGVWQRPRRLAMIMGTMALHRTWMEANTQPSPSEEVGAWAHVRTY
jgi:hypothetical protein